MKNMDEQKKFTLTHNSVTPEKVLAAADRIEELVGRVANGDQRAMRKLSVEDLALLVQFTRDSFMKR